MRIPTVLLATLMLAPAAVALDAVPLPEEGEALVDDVSNRRIVGFREMIDTSSGHYGPYRILDESANLKFVTVEVLDPVSFEAFVAADPNVEYTEVEQLHHATYTPTDPFWGTSDYQWGAKQIVVNLAWDKTRGSTAVKICVIDTGLLASHQEFSGTSRDLAGWDFVYEDSTPNDANGHGTHVAGIVGAQMNNGYGLAGTAQTTIIPIRVLNAQGTGTTTDIAQGIDYCRTQGGHVASMSLGGGASTTIQNAVVAYQNAGGLAIAAVGNDGCACTSYPAGYSGVLGVAATDKSNLKASFSNTGAAVDISAPGVAIVSSYITVSGCTTNACYVYLDGTSMATPYVSAVAGLVKSYNTALTASQISSRLTGTAQDLGAAGRDNSFGYGLVRADRAVY